MHLSWTAYCYIRYLFCTSARDFPAGYPVCALCDFSEKAFMAFQDVQHIFLHAVLCSVIRLAHKIVIKVAVLLTEKLCYVNIAIYHVSGNTSYLVNVLKHSIAV